MEKYFVFFKKLLNMLNISFIKSTKTAQDAQPEKRKNKLILRRCKAPLIKNLII